MNPPGSRRAGDSVAGGTAAAARRARLFAADQAVGAIAVGGDAIAGEHIAHHARPRIRRTTSCAGAGLAVAWQISRPAVPGA